MVQLSEEGGVDRSHLQGFSTKGIDASLVDEAETDELPAEGHVVALFWVGGVRVGEEKAMKGWDGSRDGAAGGCSMRVTQGLDLSGFA